jgi:hypothetical protein
MDLRRHRSSDRSLRRGDLALPGEAMNFASQGTFGSGRGEIPTRGSERLAAEDELRSRHLSEQCEREKASLRATAQASRAGLASSRTRANSKAASGHGRDLKTRQGGS